jgi:hypothetical protein
LNLGSDSAILRSATLKPDLKTLARAASLPYFSATLFQAGPTTSRSTLWQALHGAVEKALAVPEIAINPTAATAAIKRFNEFFTIYSSLYQSESKKQGN